MLRPVLPLFDYVINQDYISEFLCINKDKPELNCNGKCYLMQKIKAQNEEKKQNLPRIAMEEYPIGFINFASIGALKEEFRLFITPNTNYLNTYFFMYTENSFRPPISLI